MKWKKIFVNHIFNKELTLKVHKWLIQLNNKKKTNNPNKNRQRIWIDIFPNKTHWWPTGIWKVAQHHWSSGKHKLKPQWDITWNLLEWLLSLRIKNNKCWRRYGEIRTLYPVGGNEKWCTCYGKQNSTTIWFTYSTSGYFFG